jgi:hypothetical protein
MMTTAWSPRELESIGTNDRAKYGRYGGGSVDQMVADDAAASTLRLIPIR